MRISDWSSDVCSSDLDVYVLNLAEARAHSDFEYRPETGEENFHSFAGVTIVRREQSVGVLCVQHVAPRRYEDVEMEEIQTVAMVLAEMIAGAGLGEERGASEARTAQGRMSRVWQKRGEGQARGGAG